jgi:peptidoglycan/LPS O-acetylase OafA/YrhL
MISLSASRIHSPSTAASVDVSQTYYPHFDWLRAALAAIVMVHHANFVPWDNAGPFAVHVFFVLSGWLIGGILLDLKPAELPRFFYNRTLRIWIPYFIGLILLLAAAWRSDTITPKWLEIAALKAMMVYNIFGSRQLDSHVHEMPLQGSGSHFWSVNAEEQFYLIAPLLLVLLTWRRLGQSRVLWIAIAVVMWALGKEYGGLSLGILARMLLREGEQHLKPSGRILAALILLLSLPPLFSQASYVYAAPISGLMIVLLLAQRGPATSAGTVAGGMSYSLYLNHWVGVFAANFVAKRIELFEGHLLWSTVAFGVPLAFAWAHYHWIDRKIHEHRKAFYTPTRGLVATAMAYLLMAAGLAVGFAMWR